MKRNITALTLIRYLFYGISWGCTCLVFFLMGIALLDKGTLSFYFEDFLRQALGSMLIGIAFGSTSIVYQIDELPGLARVAIHFLVGMGVFYPVAIHLHWFGFDSQQIGYTVLQFLISCGIFFAIWGCFYLFEMLEAKKINARLRELTQDS